MRIAVDAGGTFTDIAVTLPGGEVLAAKAPTDHHDPAGGVLEAIDVLAAAGGVAGDELLAGASVLVHGTTRSLNALVTGTLPPTALLTTEGHRDVLVLREGGRDNPFDHRTGYPAPLIPRRLVLEVPGRVDATGAVVTELDEEAAADAIGRAVALGVEAIAVSFLWAHVNPVHERRVGELVHDLAPDVHVSLGHQVNPIVREFRRASSTVIDAALKPIMTSYLSTLEARLRAAGFGGELLIVTAIGGCAPAAEVARSPVLSLNSGPSMAPVLAAAIAGRDAPAPAVVVADTGGTTYDLSVVVGDRIPRAAEARVAGHLTGFGSVDVQGLGAGGGSVAVVDRNGLLRVGPESAGADPGPACYGAGGTRPTITDAALLTGRLDAEGFLGGRLRLDAGAATDAVATVGDRLGLAPTEAAAAILEVATETMASALLEVTLRQGVDPREAVLVAGGGAAGLNAVAIARRAGIPTVLFPATGAVMSAAGSLLAEITAERTVAGSTSTDAFDVEVVARAMAALDGWVDEHRARLGGRDLAVAHSVAARYRGQIWELDVPIDREALLRGDTTQLVADFDRQHHRLYAVSDPGCDLELLAWRAAARAPGSGGRLAAAPAGTLRPAGTRPLYVHGLGWQEAGVWQGELGRSSEVIEGPAVVDGAYSSIVVEDGATARTTAGGSLLVRP